MMTWVIIMVTTGMELLLCAHDLDFVDSVRVKFAIRDGVDLCFPFFIFSSGYKFCTNRCVSCPHTHTHTQVCTSWVPSTFAYHIPQLLICSSLFGEVYLACCVCTWWDAVPVGGGMQYLLVGGCSTCWWGDAVPVGGGMQYPLVGGCSTCWWGDAVPVGGGMQYPLVIGWFTITVGRCL